jgi:hypothetical protein
MEVVAHDVSSSPMTTSRKSCTTVADFIARPIIAVFTLMYYPPLKGCGLSAHLPEHTDGIATDATG